MGSGGQWGAAGPGMVQRDAWDEEGKGYQRHAAPFHQGWPRRPSACGVGKALKPEHAHALFTHSHPLFPFSLWSTSGSLIMNN